MTVTIQVLKGEGELKPKNHVLDKTTVLIGRDEDRDVRLTNDSVSRRHCVIEKAEDQWYVVDESSRNGVLINGVKVAERRVIRHGDVLELGEVVCRVGLGRPLKEARGPVWSIPLKLAVNLITAVMILVVVLVSAGLGWVLWRSHVSARRLTAPIEIALAGKNKLEVFNGKDRAQLEFAVPAELCGATPSAIVIRRAMPEWDLSDVWSTGVKGQAPRLFDGRDLDLAGGRRLLLADYVFSRTTYIVPDASDPYGYLYFELEGWSGLGPRVGIKDIPAIRQVDLPHYVRSIDLWPQNTQALEEVGYAGRERTAFWGQILFEPRLGHPLGTPALSKWLRPILGEPPPVQIPYEGRYYSFFYGGTRYAAVVRGSAHLLARFKGGADKLADAFFDSIDLTPLEAAAPALADLDKRVRELIEVLKVFAQKQNVTAGAGALRYNELLQARTMLLDLQRLPAAAAGEDELRTLYFNLRNRAQQELELHAVSVYEGRGTSRAEKGASALQALRDFLSDFNTISMSRDDPRFPEWTWYIEDASTKRPYSTQRVR